MSQFYLQGLVSKNGLIAPPIDRSASLATPRLAAQPWSKFSPHRILKEVRPYPCHPSSALRRRPSQPNGGGEVDTASPVGSSRAFQIYDLEREGAYGNTSQPPLATSTSSDAGDGADGSFLDAGWGVVALGGGGRSSSETSRLPAAKRDKKKRRRQQLAAVAVAEAEAPVDGAAPQRTVPTPFFDKSSEAGLTGLTLLQARLVQEGLVAHGPERKAAAAAEAAARRERKARTVRRKRDWVNPEDLDVGEGEAEEVSLEEQSQGQRQYFEFNLEADGGTEVVEFDEEGRVKARRAPGTGGHGSRSSRAAINDIDNDDPLAFLSSGEDEGYDDEGESSESLQVDDDSDTDENYSRRRAASGTTAAATSTRRQVPDRGRRGDLYDDEEEAPQQGRPMPGQDLLADEEIEWGLDELRPVGRPSLMRELGVIKKKGTPKKNQKPQQQQQQLGLQEGQQHPNGAKGRTPGATVKLGGKPDAAVATAPGPPALNDKSNDDIDDEFDEEEYDEERDVSVAWGGSGGASGIDMEQQEALLTRLFKPHKVKELMAHQRAAEAELAAMKRKASGRHVLESKVHSRMRIIAGTAAGRQLASSQGATTRPMMEKVRQAIFSIIQSQSGSSGGLPETSRWLDFFAGTGTVGLEALSRGCRECHFIELDSWVCRKVLSRNIATCGFQNQSVVHTMKAEDFLRKSIDLPRFAGGSFDFVSVCPPYLVVSYPELMGLLEQSPLLHERSIVFVEYPKQLAHQVPATLGSLITVRDRKYGRTFIRVYGPTDGPMDVGVDENILSIGRNHLSNGEGDDEGEELLLM